MDILVEAIVAAAIELGKYLATLPEKDRQAVIDSWRSQAAATAQDRQALVDELDKLKAEHAALKAAHAATP